MSTEYIENKLKEIICNYVETSFEDIKGDMNLQCDMGIDSFSLISMINTIEDEFSISIPDNELTEFRTLSDITTYIHENAA